MKRLPYLLLQGATITSLALFTAAAAAALLGACNPGVYPIEAAPRTAYFIVCDPARLRLVFQHASRPTDPAFTPSVSALDTIAVTRTTTFVEPMAGFRTTPVPAPHGFQWRYDSAGWSLPAGTSGSLGSAARVTNVFRFTQASATVPHWFTLLATAALPAFRLTAHYFARRRRRAKDSALNPCAACGYDLRATPDRCPECGAVPEVA